MSATPGWYPDPWSPTGLRYWDGASWTPHLQSSVFAEPSAHAPAGTRWSTVWIWLVVLLPLVQIIGVLFLPWDGILEEALATATDPVNPLVPVTPPVFSSPAYLLTTAINWTIWAVTIFFAYRDFAELGRRGVPKPFHWAWAFLAPVYPIGRSVVVKRRTGHGSIVMWAAIGVIVVSVIVSLVMTAQITFSMLEAMDEIVLQQVP